MSLSIQDLNIEKNVRDYWDVIVHRRWVIVSFLVICSVTVTIGTLLMTPLYKAETTIIVEGENLNVLSAEKATSEGISFDVFENYLETQMALIKSKSVAGKVAKDYALYDTPLYRQRKGLLRILNHQFSEDIELERLPGTRMISISVYNPNAEMSAELANALATTYAEDNLKRRALTFIRNQRMASLNSEFLRLQSQLDAMANQYGPKHPAMVALKEEIRVMAERINSMQDEPPSEKEKVALDNQKSLEATLLKIQESSVTSSSRMNNIVVVDPAFVPDSVAKPKILLNILLGLALGLVGGVCLAFLVEYVDDSIKTDQDLKRVIGPYTSLGSIPLESTSGSSTNGRQPNARVDHLVALKEESPSAEAYRLIRTAVLWHARKENGLKDFAVTSAGPGEGKTTVASNLAIALAQVKDKVLLVDTDMRRGRLHESYRLSNDKGLGQYLTDEVPFTEVMQETYIPHLFVVTCGRSVINSSQLLSSAKMGEFIREAHKKFDIVIYDTPPITMISDTSILIPQLQGVIMATRSGVTGSRILPKAISLVSESNAKLIGIILNGMSPVHKSYYHRYYKHQ